VSRQDVLENYGLIVEIAGLIWRGIAACANTIALHGKYPFLCQAGGS
jgi:hypothetical protein